MTGCSGDPVEGWLRCGLQWQRQDDGAEGLDEWECVRDVMDGKRRNGRNGRIGLRARGVCVLRGRACAAHVLHGWSVDMRISHACCEIELRESCERARELGI